MTIITRPDDLSFSGNFKDIEISSQVPVSVSMTHNGTSVFAAEQYSPDAAGRIVLSYRKLIDDLIVYPLPDFELLASHPTDQFIITIDNTDISFAVIKGGIAPAAVDIAVFLRANFLTWQPQTVRTTYHQPQWLSYYAATAADVKVTAYYAEELVTKPLASLTAGLLHTINVNYGYIAGLFDTYPAYYDVFVVDPQTGNRLSYVQRYRYRREEFNDDIFVFENTLGGYDSVCFTGEKKTMTEAEAEIFTSGETDHELRVDFTIGYKKNTGYITDRRTEVWYAELFKSTSRYVIHEGALAAIVIAEIKSETTCYKLNSYSFSFAIAKQTIYLNLPRVADLPEVLTIETPDQLFFLAPRLNEFRRASKDAPLFIPCQSAFADEWMSLSLDDIQGTPGTIYHNMLDAASRSLDDQHPIDAITGLRIELLRRILDTDPRLTDARPANGGNADTVDGLHAAPIGTVVPGKMASYDPYGDIAARNFSAAGYLVMYASGEESGGPAGAGTLYHDLLDAASRGKADQHPIAAVTGLRAELDARVLLTDTRLSNARPASDVYAWAKAAAKPAYTWNEISGKPTAMPADGGNADTVDNLHAAPIGTVAAGKIASYNSDGDLTARNFSAAGYLVMYASGEESGGSAGTGTLYHDLLDAASRGKADQHPIAAVTGLRAELDSRILSSDARLTDARPASDVYAWAKAIVKPGYAWNEITGKPAAFTPAAHTHPTVDITDRRGVIMTPAGMPSYSLSSFFNNIGTPDGNWWSGISLTGWAADAYTAWQMTGIAGTLSRSEWYLRSGVGDAWQPWRRIWHDGNLDPANYLARTGGTMTGSIKLDANAYLTTTAGVTLFGIDGDGMVVGDPSKTARFRSNNSDLMHERYGTRYKIWDASNAGTTAFDWSAKNITAAGDIVMYASSSETGGSAGAGTLYHDLLDAASRGKADQHPIAAVTGLRAELDSRILSSDARLTNARPASDVYAWAKAAAKPGYAWTEITGKPTSMPASDVYAWAKAAAKPAYTWNEPVLGGDITVEQNTDTVLAGWSTVIRSIGYRSRVHICANRTTGGFGNVKLKLGLDDAGINFREYLFTAGGLSYSIAADGTRKQFAFTSDIPTTLPASDVYAWAKAATKPVYTWGEITGKPATFTPSAHSHAAIDVTDRRGAAMVPSGMLSNTICTFFSNLGTPTADWWSGISVTGWNAASYAAWQMAGFATTSVWSEWYLRSGIGANWQPWRRIWHDGNLDPNAYLARTGGTMTGSIKLDANAYLTTTAGVTLFGIDGDGMVVGDPSKTARFRSNNSDLMHERYGTRYKIWDASNAGTSAFDWNAKNIVAAGTITATGTIKTAGSVVMYSV